MWEEDEEYRFRTSGGDKPTFRIVLKTKNEPELVEKWIEHHIRIVGADNIVIFDNMSEDEDVLAVYQKYFGKVAIFQFSEFHDYIHHTTKFPVLHAALKSSAIFYTIFDSDEFLYFYDKGRFCADTSLVRKLANLSPKRSVPTVWLYTAPGYERRPMCSGRPAFVDGLTWGKTIFRSDAHLSGLVSHNCQLPAAEFMQPSPVRGFFLFHLALLSPKQRIRANMAKLVAAGLAAPDASVAAVLANDPDGRNMYVRQIRQLRAAEEPVTSDQDPIPATVIALLQDGTAVFASPSEQVRFNSFVADFPAICAATFAPAAQAEPG